MSKINDLGTVITTDVLVLGAGGAGMLAALKASESGASVLMIDKMGIGWNGQVPIGGGILAYIHPDYVDTWVEKVVRDSNYFCNQDWTEIFGRAMHKSTYDLADMGLTFLKKDGKLNILNWGPNIYVTLFDAPKSLVALKKVAKARGVKMMDKIFAIDLLKNNDQVVGAIGLGLVDGKTYIFNARSTIVATGGCGYQHEKTYASCQGEGAAMGFRAGAQLIGAEFGSSYVWGIKLLGKELMGIHFYLYLENARGEKIMGKYYPELMTGSHAVYTFDPRVINAMQKEFQAGLGPIYLNLKGLTDEDVVALGDDPNEELSHLMGNDTMRVLREKAHIDPLNEKMEMWPRYLNGGGGMRVDTSCRTTVPGLWATGAACTNTWSNGGGMQAGLGVQSAAVTGSIAGESAAKSARDATLQEIDFNYAKQALERVMEPVNREGDLDPADVLYRIHEAIVPMKFNRQRTAQGMQEALKIVQDAREKLDRVTVKDFHDLARYHSAESMVFAAENTYQSALLRQESRAGHFRLDFPDRDDKNWFKFIVIDNQNGKPSLSTLPVPLDKFKYKPPK
ncbi:MAG: FAD-binding protein [Dehalococcoidales bacterium]|nr:FAD-binding protein [Dehalococcoidales bacterium]